MRELKYAVEGKAANLRTFAVDEPGHGGACHKYRIDWMLSDGDIPAIVKGGVTFSSKGKIALVLADIHFQNGPIIADGNGVNGIQNEDLLAIVIDRLEGFQSGPYKSDRNEIALHHAKIALKSLQDRTRERIARGVEGTHNL